MIFFLLKNKNFKILERQKRQKTSLNKEDTQKHFLNTSWEFPVEVYIVFLTYFFVQ